MNQFITPYEKHFEGFDSTRGTLLDSHGFWNSENDSYTPSKKEKMTGVLAKPEEFGDNYSDELSKDDFLALNKLKML